MVPNPYIKGIINEKVSGRVFLDYAWYLVTYPQTNAAFFVVMHSARKGIGKFFISASLSNSSASFAREKKRKMGIISFPVVE